MCFLTWKGVGVSGVLIISEKGERGDQRISDNFVRRYNQKKLIVMKSFLDTNVSLKFDCILNFPKLTTFCLYKGYYEDPVTPNLEKVLTDRFWSYTN